MPVAHSRRPLSWCCRQPAAGAAHRARHGVWRAARNRLSHLFRGAKGPPYPVPWLIPTDLGCQPVWSRCAGVALAFKDGDLRDLVMVLAPIVSGSIVAALAGDSAFREVLASGNGPVLVVPIPSAPAGVLRRGGSPLELLTREAAPQMRLSERELMFMPALRLRPGCRPGRARPLATCRQP
jgi:hypothetical protein